MRVAAFGCTLAAALLTCRALAGDFEDGMTAYKNKDYAGALTLLRRAADQWVASAQFNLGFMYVAGQGVTRDEKQAVSWFRRGAVQGHASSQLNLALMYFKGQGVAHDYKQAVSWFQKAAAQGDAEAQDNLALMYVNGHGTAQDYKQAAFWFQKAAAQGFAKRLEQLVTIRHAIAHTNGRVALLKRKPRDSIKRMIEEGLGVSITEGFIVVDADLAGKCVAAVTSSLGDLVGRAKQH